MNLVWLAWRDTLTPAQAQRIEQDHGEMMRQFGRLVDARKASGG